jgi:tryptophan synthase beta chain
VAYALKAAREISRDQIVIVNLSGRGDKDVNSVREVLES